MKFTSIIKPGNLLICFCIFLSIGSKAATITSTASGGQWHLGTSWVGGVAPSATDDVIIEAGATVIVVTNVFCNSLDIENGATFTVDGTLTIANDITVPHLNASDVTVTINGGGNISCTVFNIGDATTTGNNSGRTTTVTFNLHQLTITNSGNLTIRSTFGSGNSGRVCRAVFSHQSGTINVSGGVVMTNGSSGNCSSTYTLGGSNPILKISGSTAFSSSGNGTFTTTWNGTGATVEYAGAAQTVRVTPYTNLALSGSDTKTLTSVTNIPGNLTLSGTASATTAAAFSIGGNLDIQSGATFATGATNTFTLAVTGTTNVAGTLTLANTGNKSFTGDVTVSGTWTESAAAAISFAGNLSNTGSFSASTGVHTFSGSNKTLDGTLSIPSVSFSGTYQNNGSLTVSTTFAGAGTLVNASNATLDYGGSTAIAPTLTATASGNTVVYSRAGAQTVKGTQYQNLTLAGTSAKTTTSVTVNGILSMEGTATASAAISYGANATLQYNTSTNRTAGTNEWPAAITTGTLGGGIIIANTGIISLGANRTTLNVPLKVNAGSTLALSTFSLGSTIGPSSLTMEIGTSGASITGTGTLTLGGNVNVTYLGSGSGTATISCPVALVNSSSRTFTVDNGGNATDLTVSGVISTSGSVTKAGAGTMAFSNAGNSFTGSVTINAGTLAVGSVSNGGANSNLGAGSSVVLAGGTLSYTGATSNFNKTIDLSSGTTSTIAVTTNGAVLTANGVISSTTGNLTVVGPGTLQFGSQNVSVNNLTISSGAILNAGSSNLTINGTFTRTGTFTAGTSTAIFGGSAQTIPTSGVSYNNVRIINAGTKTLAGNMIIAGNLEVNGGTLDLQDFTANRSTAGGSLTVADGATLKIGVSGIGSVATFPTNYTTVTLGNNSTVEYAGADQEIATRTYGNLILSGDDAKYFAPSTGTTTVKGILTLTRTIELLDNTLVLENAPVSTGGSIDASAVGATLEFNNTADDIIVPAISLGQAIQNLTIRGGKQVSIEGTGTTKAISNNLTISNNSKLGIGANNVLKLTGTVSMSTANCLVGVRSATLELGGTSSQDIYFDQSDDGASNGLRDLTVNKNGAGNQIFLKTLVKVIGTVGTDNAGRINTEDNLVLMSTADSTGKLFNPNPANLVVTGQVAQERYVPSKTTRRWMFLSSPVDAVSVRDAWQDDIFITGAGTGGSPCGTTTGNGLINTDKYNTNGFDATVANNGSLYRFDSSAWKLLPGTSTLLNKGQGYRVMYRGARQPNEQVSCSTWLTTQTPPLPTATTLEVKGNVITGTFTRDLTSGFNLLGNPYMCEFNFNSFYGDPVNSGVIANKYWSYDPWVEQPEDNSTLYFLYQFTEETGANVTGNRNPNITSDNAGRIASSQAFFVQTVNFQPGNAVTFKDIFKSTETQRGAFRNSNAFTTKIRITYKKGDDSFLDDALINFVTNPAVSTTASNSTYDATSFNAGTFIATMKGIRSLAIHGRPLDFYNDTVAIRVSSLASGNFKFNFSEFEEFTQAAQIILLDGFTGTQHNVKANPVYAFSITSNAASQGTGRFKLVFRSQASVLPLSFLSVAATQKQTGVDVTWKLAFEQNVSSYTVERSNNGRDFEAMGSVNSKGNSNVAVDYSFLDTKAFTGTVYYRIKSNEVAAEAKYSAVVKVNASKESKVALFPNPAKDQIKLTVSTADLLRGASILVRNAQGKTVIQQTVNSTALNYTLDISSLTPGVYFITLINNDSGDALVERFIKQ